MSLTGFETTSAEEEAPHLTARELQVLEQVAHGLHNREIGERLGISEQTVKNHMWRLLRKLSSPDRTRAVVVAIERGWIPVAMELDSEPLDGTDGVTHGVTH
jgi:DNA-binding NarL/FixJ family response regulator